MFFAHFYSCVCPCSIRLLNFLPIVKYHFKNSIYLTKDGREAILTLVDTLHEHGIEEIQVICSNSRKKPYVELEYCSYCGIRRYGGEENEWVKKMNITIFHLALHVPNLPPTSPNTTAGTVTDTRSMHRRGKLDSN